MAIRRNHAWLGHGAVLVMLETLYLRRRLALWRKSSLMRFSPSRREALRLDGVTVSFDLAGHVLGLWKFSLRLMVRIVALGDLKMSPIRTCRSLSPSPATSHHREGGTFGLLVLSRRRPGCRDRKAHAFGDDVSRAGTSGRAYSLGKAQRVMAWLRGRRLTTGRSTCRAVEAITRYYASRIDLGEIDWPVTPPRPILRAQLRSARHRS